MRDGSNEPVLDASAARNAGSGQALPSVCGNLAARAASCRHERCYSRRQQILDLDHYLDALSRKPGALAGSTALVQWREQGRWKEAHDQLWRNLNARHGRQNGTRAMVDIIKLGREHGYQRLEQTITQALELGCSDVEAVRYLLLSETLVRRSP